MLKRSLQVGAKVVGWIAAIVLALLAIAALSGSVLASLLMLLCSLLIAILSTGRLRQRLPGPHSGGAYTAYSGLVVVLLVWSIVSSQPASTTSGKLEPAATKTSQPAIVAKSENTASSTVSTAPPPTQAPANTVAPSNTPVPTNTPKATNTPTPPSWNTEDLDILSNGNMLVAWKLLKALSASDTKENAESISPGAVMKAPWKFYGKIIAIQGTVGIVQDYPPGNPITKALGGEVGEVVMMAKDATIIDYMQLGSTGDTKTGEFVTVYGMPIGQVEVENKLGGKTTQLVLIGKLIE